MTATRVVGVEAGLATRNQLLRGLPSEEGSLLAERLERVSLEFGTVLHDVHGPITDLYFPETAVASMLSVMADGGAVETATIGAEGVTGIAVFHGVESTPEHTYVQVAGAALRLRADDLHALLPQLPTLARRLHRFTVALLTLAAQNSGCNRKHTMVQRCARWLLMTHDRVEGDRFAMTHHVLSQMLGVRRASVTEAAQELSAAGAIDYSRGVVRVTDRAALERMACECHAIIRSAFDRMLGEARKSPRGETVDPLRSMDLTENGKSSAGDGGPRID